MEATMSREERTGESGLAHVRLDDIKPLRDRIAEMVRESIIDGKIRPGERLVEPELAGRLGVSRTPLREALLQLDSEGFVNMTPRRGAVVSELSREDAMETYLVKGALESLAARLACERITDGELVALRDIHDRMARLAAARTRDHRRILQLNTEFHSTISSASHNDKLIQYIRVLRSQALRYNYIYLSVLSHLSASLREHARILDAIARREGETAEQLVRAHGDAARTALCAFIDHQKAAGA
jgi:DNA-binding GntR family transcriptional regulator